MAITTPMAIPLVTLSLPSNNSKSVLSYHFLLTTISLSQFVSVGVGIHLSPCSVTLQTGFSPHVVASVYKLHACGSTHFESAFYQTHLPDAPIVFGHVVPSVMVLQTTGGVTFLAHVFLVASHEQNLLTEASLHVVSFVYLVQSISAHDAPLSLEASTLFHTQLGLALQSVSLAMFPQGVTVTVLVAIFPHENAVHVHLFISKSPYLIASIGLLHVLFRV